MSNEEFIHTVKDKKIKFTHVAEKQRSSKMKFFNKINTVSENSEHGGRTLLLSTKVNFNIVGISESRIKQNKNPIDNDLLLYNKDIIIYKLRKDSKIYKSKYLESIFLEVIDQSGENIHVGCIYRHPCMDLSKFDNDYLSSISEKLLREKNKHIILMGDFNVDLLNYTTGTSTTQFLDQMYTLFFISIQVNWAEAQYA